MSDISKKIFSIDPEPDEGPLAHVPPPEDGESDVPQLKLRETPQAEEPVFRPILDVINLEDKPEAADDPVEDEPILDLSEEVEATKPLNLRPDDLAETSEDIAEPVETVSEDPVENVTADAIVVRPAIAAPVAAREPLVPPHRPADIMEPPRSLTWVAPVLGLFTALAVGGLVYAYIASADRISGLGYASLILAVLVSAVSVAILWITLRALSASQTQSARLEAAATRLTAPSDSVAGDVERLVDRIQQQLTALSDRLVQTKSETEILGKAVSDHNDVLERISTTMSERSATIAQSASAQKDDYATLSTQLAEQIDAANLSVSEWRDKFSQVGDTVARDIETAAQSLDGSAAQLAQTGQALRSSAETTTTAVKSSDNVLKARGLSLTSTLSQIDETVARQAERLSSLTAQLSEQGDTLDRTLLDRAERLASLDKDVDAAEARLTRLLDRASDVRDEMMARFTELEEAMEAFDNRSQRSSTDLSERVGGSLSELKTELSAVKTDLVEMRSNLKDTRPASPVPDAPQIAPTKTIETYVEQAPLQAELPAPSLDLTPIDEADLLIPEEPLETPLELTMAVEQPPEADLVTRPGVASPPPKVFGRNRSKDKSEKSSEKSNWRWRDMLGGLDEDGASAESQPRLQRPPAGVPLTPPPPAPDLPDGSDVVARLCEVKLAPSAIVDEGTIIDATSARLTGGEDRQVDMVVGRLNAPVIHLRGVLAADLEFKLRAEAFRRNYDAHLSTLRDTDRMRAEMGSASGRAYLLCAAALKTG